LRAKLQLFLLVLGARVEEKAEEKKREVHSTGQKGIRKRRLGWGKRGRKKGQRFSSSFLLLKSVH